MAATCPYRFHDGVCVKRVAEGQVVLTPADKDDHYFPDYAAASGGISVDNRGAGLGVQ